MSRARAHSNVLPIDFSAVNWRDSSAFQELVEEVSRLYSSLTEGDKYGMGPRSILTSDEIPVVYGGFKILYQGDHLGVEFALSSHTIFCSERACWMTIQRCCVIAPFVKAQLNH